MNSRSAKYALALLVLGTSACRIEEKQRFEKYRLAIQHDMIDPSSVEFRNEQIRTLWSKEGSRFRLYCAEINGNNRFGGKTGYRNVFYVISLKAVGVESGPFKSGEFYIEDAMTHNFYWYCERTDTERANDKIFMWTITIPPFDTRQRSEADKMVPVISSLNAPETR